MRLFSDEGGYHQIFEIRDHHQEMFPNIANADVLIRIPRAGAGAPTPVAGMAMGRRLVREGYNIPNVYNTTTLATDDYYVVEKVPRDFDGRNARHVADVSRALANIATAGSGPDFRPANVRFRDNGEMVLIDFSENPGVHGAP